MLSTETDFYNVMVARLSKKKADRITGVVKTLLTCYVQSSNKHLGINQADYANAFGIVQGVAYSLGYESAASTTDVTKPGYFFDVCCAEVGAVA